MRSLSHVEISLMTVRRITEGADKGLDLGEASRQFIAEVEPFFTMMPVCVGNTWAIMVVDAHKCPVSEHIESHINDTI